MGLFRKKTDPISERARALSAEIAALETRIQQLGSQVPDKSPPRVRSAASPGEPRSRTAATRAHVPIFEANDYQKHSSSLEPEITSQHFNDLGVRKYDLAAAGRRVKNWFRAPSTHNPKLVSYLAAGSIKGLRPLRYEKRVARNRFIALFVGLVLMIWGIAAVFLRH